MTTSPTVGNAWSDVGGFIANVGNAIGAVTGGIKSGQNNSDTKPSAAQTAATQANTKLLIIGGIVVALLVAGGFVLSFFRGKSK